ncbi:fungal specific transcription factor domain protein [Metarhizium album ARSEF 1941]|uniref:Fungal specific transcription factor domain protein n=1 Tax=Metarhizium album (strain ARSEF 1941) TaxID=1081103 RepID=A0A0B2WLS1_METAS|nr:fungal specific transcription factor domain protein [Metarhizium album ARSEF 1941]KHN94432.1 fungal specific transcription factor domain protein [Metarhizium album ARSEF 1941]
MHLSFTRLSLTYPIVPTWQKQNADPETHPNLTDSEKKIDQIESRLGNIEVLLKNIANPAAPFQFSYDPAAVGNTPQTVSSSIPTAASSGDFDSSDDESAYGGDTGLVAHTTFASEFLESAVRRTSLREVNPKMAAGLNNLSQLVEMQKRRSISHGPRFPLQKPVPPGGISKLPMPPMQAVVNLLKHAKGAPPTLFTIMCSLVGLPDFTALCRRVYFATEEFSDATFLIVNAMLYNLFMEQNSLATDPAARDEYHAYMRQSQANLETALANTSLFLATRVENVQALLLGALYAVDVSRPSVAWHLSCMAAQLCQTGGFHRSESLKFDPPATAKLKRILFWHVYTVDKGLGLRLGRSPVIHECDIDIPRVFEFDGLGQEDSSTIPTLWIKMSYLQSRIYEQLYSPSALKSPPAELVERVERARALASECRKFEVEADEARNQTYDYLKAVNSSDLVDLFLRGDEVQFQVTLTLVYRVIPAPEGSVSRFCDECLATARKAMKVHQECTRRSTIGGYFRSIYIHWFLFRNLLLTPFAPFFVLFCYVIETGSLDDLRLLQEFVDSLDEARDASETIEKLYRLCQVMCDVASLYVEAKSQQQQDQTMVPIGDEFEMYLSQLGFMPTEDQAMGSTGTGSGPPPLSNQAAQLADWFSGNRNMMGLLEEDFSSRNTSSNTSSNSR